MLSITEHPDDKSRMVIRFYGVEDHACINLSKQQAERLRISLNERILRIAEERAGR